MNGQQPLLRISMICAAIILGSALVGSQLSTSGTLLSFAPKVSEHENDAEDGAGATVAHIVANDEQEGGEDGVEADGDEGEDAEADANDDDGGGAESADGGEADFAADLAGDSDAGNGDGEADDGFEADDNEQAEANSESEPADEGDEAE